MQYGPKCYGPIVCPRYGGHGHRPSSLVVLDDPHHKIPLEWSFAREPSRGCQWEGLSIKVLDLELGAVSTLLLGVVLEVVAQKGGRTCRGTVSPRLVRDAHRRANVVPPNCKSGLLLVDNEVRV